MIDHVLSKLEVERLSSEAGFKPVLRGIEWVYFLPPEYANHTFPAATQQTRELYTKIEEEDGQEKKVYIDAVAIYYFSMAAEFALMDPPPVLAEQF